MNELRDPAGDSAPQEELSRLRRERATLEEEVKRLQQGELPRLRARVVKTALIVALPALAALWAIHLVLSWFFR